MHAASPQHGRVRDDVEGDHDPPATCQLVDGLEAGGCRKAQARTGAARPGVEVFESVAHATRLQSSVCGPPWQARGGNMMARRSAGKTRIARALWYAKKGAVELRAAPLAAACDRARRACARCSAASAGARSVWFSTGAVGQSEWERMRAPMQEGAFPFPVKYGYCADGVVEEGPAELLAAPVFCLHPHQDCFNAPIDALAPFPRACPRAGRRWPPTWRRRSTPLWDSGAGPGDRIVVVGAGVVGLLVAIAGGAAAGRGGDGRRCGRGPPADRRSPGRGLCAARSMRPAMPMSCFTPAPPPPVSTPPSIAPGSRHASSR